MRPRLGHAEGEQDFGGSHARRSHSHVDLNPSEICCITSGGVCKREERNSYCKELWRPRTEFHWSAFLGKRILYVDIGQRRGSDPSIHPKARGI